MHLYSAYTYPPTPAAQGGARKGKGVCDTAGVANPPTPADARGSAPGNKTFSADHLEACNSSSNSSSSRQQQAAVGSSRQSQSHAACTYKGKQQAGSSSNMMFRSPGPAFL